MSEVNYKEQIVSLGPTCVPAEILKSASLRDCTYGFDWFRSGDYFLEVFFNQLLENFLHRCVFTPSIPLRQESCPTKTNSFTSDVEPIEVQFGFNYLYNPHRDYSQKDNLDYFRRSFTRLSHVLDDKSVCKHFFIADYLNKPGSIFFHQPLQDLERVASIIDNSCVYPVTPYSLTLLRIEIVRSSDYICSTELIESRISDLSTQRIIKARISSQLDTEGTIRNDTYKKIAEMVFDKEKNNQKVN